MTDYEKLALDAKELAAKATPGPWKAWTDQGDCCVAHGDPSEWLANVGSDCYLHNAVAFDMDEKADAEFMAASRQLVPDLADAVLHLLASNLVLMRALKNQVRCNGDCAECEKTVKKWIRIAEYDLKRLEKEGQCQSKPLG